MSSIDDEVEYDSNLFISDKELNDKWEVIRVCGRIPPPRHAHTSTLIGDSIYVFGGYGIGGTHLGDLHKFSMEDAKWHRIKNTAKIQPRHSHSAVEYDGCLWIFGGIGKGEENNVYNDIWQYNPETDQWLVIPNRGNYNPEPRWGHTALVVNDSMLVFGGINETSFYNNILRFDFKTKEWVHFPIRDTQLSPVPHGRQYHSMALVGNKIYVFGGYDGLVSKNDMYELNLDTMVWRGIMASNGRHVVRRGAVTFSRDGIIYQFGGRNKNLTDSIFQFDTETLTWEELLLADRPSKRQFASGVLYNNSIYIFGGQSDYNENDIYRYKLDRTSGKNRQQSPHSYSGNSCSSDSINCSTLSDNIENLVDNPMFSDIKFSVEGRIIHAHKCILYSRSEHFKAMITIGMKESTEAVITISGTSYEAFHAIIHYLYTGRLYFNRVDIVELLSLSDRYLINDIKNQCTKYLINLTNSTNLESMRKIAETYSLIDLKKKIKSIEDFNDQ